MPGTFAIDRLDRLTDNEMGRFGHLHTMKEVYCQSIRSPYTDVLVYTSLVKYFLQS